MVNRRHLEESLLAARSLEDAHLDGDRTSLHHVDAADEDDQQLSVCGDRQKCQRRADRERTDVAHEDARGRRVEPQKPCAATGKGCGEHRKVQRVDHIAVDRGITKLPIRNDRECEETHHRGTARQTIEAIGDIDRIAGCPDHEAREHDEDWRGQVPSGERGASD